MFSKRGSLLIIESLFPMLILPIPLAELSKLSKFVWIPEYFCKNFLGSSPCSIKPNFMLKELLNDLLGIAPKITVP